MDHGALTITIRARMNVIARLFADRFSDRARTTSRSIIRLDCYGKETPESFNNRANLPWVNSLLYDVPSRCAISYFQGRHKRNATFPGGQTTILQVTPTIRSEYLLLVYYVNFIVCFIICVAISTLAVNTAM